METVSIDDDDENDKGKKQNFGDNKTPKKQKTSKSLKRKLGENDFSSLPPAKKQKIIEKLGSMKEKMSPMFDHVPKNHFLYKTYKLYKKSNIKIFGNDVGKKFQLYLCQNKQFNLSRILSQIKIFLVFKVYVFFF